jgi:hypothetical protein
MPGIWFDGPGGGGGIADVVDDTSPQLGGNLDANGFTVDGRTVATDGTKLDGVEASADVTDVTNVTAAGALMDSELTDIVAVKAASDASIAVTNTGTSATAFVTPAGLKGSALQLKVDGIEALADVTDATNVAAAGALMDSEVDADIKTLVLPASTTISTFGASLVDDADAPTARTTLGVDAAGTDNAPAASDTVAGKVELATTAEIDTGTDTTRAITPAGLAASALAVNQTRGIYADAAARDTALSGILTEGQSAWLLDVNRETTYDGTNWIITGGVMPRLDVYVNSITVADGGSGTLISMATGEVEVEDTDGIHGATDGWGTVPAGLGGDWIIGSATNFATNSTGIRSTWLLVEQNTTNGEGDNNLYQSLGAHTTLSGRMAMSAVRRLEAGALVKLYGYQTSGGDLSVNGRLQMTMIRHMPELT